MSSKEKAKAKRQKRAKKRISDGAALHSLMKDLGAVMKLANFQESDED